MAGSGPGTGVHVASNLKRLMQKVDVMSLTQTIGRAERNVGGQVIMYADNIKGSMERAIQETNRRRIIQQAYNEKHGTTPTTVIKAVRELITGDYAAGVAEERAS
jgi:excinuclease ABC subunit B